MVTRAWKRDGSTNVMPLDVACHSLRSNGHSGRSNSELAEVLLSGGVLETPKAEFYVPGKGRVS
jgi:hypothetical protein